MGAQNVSQAFLWAADRQEDALDPAEAPPTPNEMRLLIWMSLHALDRDIPPRYFMRREGTAVAFGRKIPDEPDPESPDAEDVRRERAAAFQRIKIATQGLVKKGAIRRVRRGREGVIAEYALIFGGTSHVPLIGTPDVPLSESPRVPHSVRDAYPQGTTEEQQDKGRGRTPGPAAPHLHPVESGAHQ